MIRILFLAANPTDQLRLQSRREFDQLRHALDAAPHGRRFHLIQEFAVAADGLQELLVRHQPRIVHFSGHGSEAGLLFEAADGRSQRVAPATLRDLFTGFRTTVRCVVLNACYSQQHADAIATVIDSVVGMSDALTDDAALAFATAFYRALANGAILAEAVALGRNQLDLQNLDEAHKPQLLADRIDAEHARALDWDDAAPTTTPSKPRGIFGLYPFNQHFFGRDEELTTLHTELQTERSVSICPVITGMGGLGKTQLAAHYARAHVADYPNGIFWITAVNLKEIRPQLADFCVALGLPVADPQRAGDLTEQKISAFKGYLDQHPHALLIFDNVEEPDHLRTYQIGVQLTVLTLGGKIIVTTRRRKLPGDKFVELPLQRLLPIPARLILTTLRPDLTTDPDLDRLCEQFGYLPLMLNLAAAALKKPGRTIAGYLQRLQMLGAEQLHSTVAKVNLDDYHKSLTAVLQEQWAMLQDDNACLLLRVAGQLPEAAVIPIARLGLLAGLVDVDEWERPLSDGLDELEIASLLERVDEVTVRLHPLVHNFAVTLIDVVNRTDFCTSCVQKLADAYADVRRLGHEYATRGISALLADLVVAIDLCYVTDSSLPQIANQLQSLLHLLRRESSHLQGLPETWQPERLWQQLLLISISTGYSSLTQQLSNALRHKTYWLPLWVYQRQSATLEQTLTGHEDNINVVAVIDAHRIISASDDHSLKVWNLKTGSVEQTLTEHEVGVNAVIVLGADRIVSASYDCSLKVWNLNTGAVEKTFTGHKDRVNAITVLDDHHIISASNDCTLKVWNLSTGTIEQTLTGHEASVNSVAVLDRQYIVSAAGNFERSDYTLKVWNLRSGTAEQTFHGYENAIRGVAVLDARRIVFGANNTLKIWNFDTHMVEQTLVGHKDRINAVAVLDDDRIISASYDCTLKIWNLSTGIVEQTLAGHESSVNAVSIVNRQLIVSAAGDFERGDYTLKVWNLNTDERSPNSVRQSLHVHEAPVNDILLIEGQRIVSTSSDGTFNIRTLATGVVEETLLWHAGWTSGIAVLDAQHILVVGYRNRLSIWNLDTGKIVYTPTRNRHIGHGDVVKIFDHKHVISMWKDRTLKIWNLHTGEIKQTFVGHSHRVNALAVLDDQRVISASDDHTLKVWNLQTCGLEQTLIDHKAGVLAVTAFDKQRVISASSDRTLKVWNLANNSVEQTLTGHEASVSNVSVLDDQRVISASDDHTIKVWNLQKGSIIASIELDGTPQNMTISHLGRYVVVVNDMVGSLYCLELVDPAQREAYSKEHLPYC